MKDTKPSNNEKNSSHITEVERGRDRVAARYHTELARFSTWLFSGVIISITFLLLAGLRNPHTLLLVFMYIALGAFSLTALLYPLIVLLSGKVADNSSQILGSDKKALGALEKTKARLSMQLKTLQYVQQIVFVIGVLAALGFAIEVSLYLFATPVANPAGQTG